MPVLVERVIGCDSIDTNSNYSFSILQQPPNSNCTNTKWPTNDTKTQNGIIAGPPYVASARTMSDSPYLLLG